jgi:hypothetical protein
LPEDVLVAIFFTLFEEVAVFLTGLVVFLGIALTTFAATLEIGFDDLATGFLVIFTTGELFFGTDFLVATTFFLTAFAGATFLATTIFEVVFLTEVVFGIFARC